MLQIFDQDYARMLFCIFGYSVVRANRFQEYHWAMSFRLKCYKILWFDSYCRSSDTLQTDMCQTVCSVWQLFDDIQCVWQYFEDTQCKTKTGIFLRLAVSRKTLIAITVWEIVDLNQCVIHLAVSGNFLMTFNVSDNVLMTPRLNVRRKIATF